MKRTTLLAAVLTIMFAASCTLGGLDTAQIARELSPAVAVLSAMEAAMALPVNPAVASRALDPSTSGVGLNKMPADVYNEALLFYGVPDLSTVRIPTDGTYFNDYYTEGTQAYIKMKHESADIYRVWLHLFPRLDMTTSEVIEEYLVYNDKLETTTSYWGYYNESGQPNSWISQQTILSDGTIANRNTMWTSAGGSQYYAGFTAPSFTDGITPYIYPETLPLPATTGTGVWSSKTVSNYTADTGGVRMDIVEYYTEIGSESSGVQYFVKGKKNSRSTKDWGVTRSTTNLDTGAKTIRTLVTTGDSTSKWFTSV